MAVAICPSSPPYVVYRKELIAWMGRNILHLTILNYFKYLRVLFLKKKYFHKKKNDKLLHFLINKYKVKNIYKFYLVF